MSRTDKAPPAPRALSRAELELALVRHGADITAWPPQVRAGASALFKADPAARALLSEGRQMDALFHRALSGPPSESDVAAAGRVAARLAARPLPAQAGRMPVLPGWLLAFDLRPAWPSIAALAGMAMLGFLMGSHAFGPGGFDPRFASQRVTVADADVSAIMFEPDPLAETGL